MNCVHCRDPLPDPWHLGQDEPLPGLRVGSLVVAKKATGVCDPGERGVVCEAYELGKRPRWSVIFQSGRHDGFSPCEVDFVLDVSGEVCEELSDYAFENVPRLVDHLVAETLRRHSGLRGTGRFLKGGLTSGNRTEISPRDW